MSTKRKASDVESPSKPPLDDAIPRKKIRPKSWGCSSSTIATVEATTVDRPKLSSVAHRLIIPTSPSKSDPVPAIRSKNSINSKPNRYSAPIKMPDSCRTSKIEHRLSSIVKAKNKNENCLPVAWRKELYGPKPGSAQARLENLRVTLQKEIEEQANSKFTSQSSRDGDVASQIQKPSTSSHSVKIDTEGLEATKVKTIKSTCSPKETASLAVSPVLDTGVERDVKQPEESGNHQMDVDDVDVPGQTVKSPISNRLKCDAYPDNMECDSFTEAKSPVVKEADSTECLQQQERKENESKLKTKYHDGLSAYSNYFYCIIDTCVFIENYKDLESFLTKKYAGRQPIVVVPYKVLHELDTVKHKKPQLGSKITPVVKFLHQLLRMKDARVKGQHPWDDTVELMPIISPDDSIVNCALQVQSVADSSVSVVLVSNDCNMLTKALVANLSSCTMQELQSDYKF